uniref:Putative membrane-associated protein n=1 Tax=uncultured marine thaumarchaeote SAT1000_13_B06 TaxID=1456381 RepID=A0A075I380_9ARCH|nr:putative membrane-associated protein [uncultured marine thaumarchaeote SAT1000_13_B06]
MIKKEEAESQHLDSETIFQAKPDLRDDDKEIINFLSANGGQAYESELRKKFLLPRTTMWRAVKRLERQGIIEIVKKDLQNIVKLKVNWRIVNEQNTNLFLIIFGYKYGFCHNSKRSSCRFPT